MFFSRFKSLLFAGLLLALLSNGGAVPALAEQSKDILAASAGAELVGSTVCWQCHKNENHATASPGAVNCEDCHGAGSLAVKDLHEEKGRMACNYKTFIAIGKLSPQGQSAICMKCHSQLATFALHNWNASAHNLNGVSCIDCHNIHHGDNLKPARDKIATLCSGCHQSVKAAFMLPNHHPVIEGKVTCTDCHNPHGSPYPGPMLIRATVKETCTRCHAEKEGPFVFEHADLMEDCTICHMSHGSQNDFLLSARLPFLCKKCHTPHSPSTANRTLRYTNCTNCHSQIHGTDLNFPPGGEDGFMFR
jgi:DmsE family decaheme c-type cytochrome